MGKTPTSRRAHLPLPLPLPRKVHILRAQFLCSGARLLRTNKRLPSRLTPADAHAPLFLADSSVHKPPAVITTDVIFRVPSQTTLIRTSHAADKALARSRAALETDSTGLMAAAVPLTLRMRDLHTFRTRLARCVKQIQR